MKYRLIEPLGKRSGIGSFDTFFDTKKYTSQIDAEKNNDMVCVNFVEDENKVKHFEAYHTKDKENKIYKELHFQNFPFGIDIIDDQMGCEMAKTFLTKNHGK